MERRRRYSTKLKSARPGGGKKDEGHVYTHVSL